MPSSINHTQPITLRILDGADRGRVYSQFAPPITIGREEGNVIQLNDERVSRFHLKIQRDHDDLVLTDLASTNGTKVNGEETHLRILRHGDMISVGRSTLVFGSRSEINQRMRRLRKQDITESVADLESGEWSKIVNQSNAQLRLLELDPPGLPARLTPGQAAQLSEVLEFIHLQLRQLIQAANIEPRSTKIEMDVKQWHHVIDLQARVAEYLRNISLPEE